MEDRRQHDAPPEPPAERSLEAVVGSLTRSVYDAGHHRDHHLPGLWRGVDRRASTPFSI